MVVGIDEKKGSAMKKRIRHLSAGAVAVLVDARSAAVDEIRAALAAAGTPIGPYDVLIAGQAKARELVLVTSNAGDFNRVAGLRVEDCVG